MTHPPGPGGASRPATAAFCGACGQPGAGMQYCTRCGASLLLGPAPTQFPVPPVQHPAQYPPPAPFQAPARPPGGRGGSALPWIVGVLSLAVIALAATGIWLRTGGDDGNPSGQGATSEPTQPASPGSTDEPVDDPLDLGRGLVNQDCTGEFVVMLASSGDPSAYASTLAPALEAAPDAAYLVTDESCGSFNQSVDGNRIYAAYEGPFDSRAAACAARSASTFRGAYVRELDASVTERDVCGCETSAGEPVLSRHDPAGEVARQYAVTDVQVLLKRAGTKGSGVLNGTFDKALHQLVRRFQKENGLEADGVVGTDTWTALRAYC
ncbi:MAG: peptidoglycan-binding protein [Nocardioides sp.]|uniref:peptidoglycan-binding domain-containing protein n=1 Tax=Nocardioides sp. TaxID=35761 RepID=UPI003F0CF9FE